MLWTKDTDTREKQLQDVPNTSWISKSVVIGESTIHGRGLFAACPIKREETIIVFGGQLFSMGQVRQGLVRNQSVSGYAEGVYIGIPTQLPPTSDEYLNHSCDPNLWLVGPVTVVSRRDISAGEELTLDYATFEIDNEWKLSGCNCGSDLCRHNITGHDWMNVDLRLRYDDHFLPCLNDRIRRANG
jgi:hypothetical protein